MEFILHREAFVIESAGPFDSLGVKEKKQKTREDDNASMSRRIPWRFFGFVTEVMALMSSNESERIQIDVMPR